MSTQESNNGLYFIVGALVVIVALMGFIFLGNNDGDVMQIEPAAGMEEAVDETSSTFELNIDDEGVSGTTTQSTPE